MGRPRIPSEHKFYAKIEKSNGCWKWIGSFDRDGYPLFWDGDIQKMKRGHQYSYELHHGERNGKCVMHTCDNPSCVNPAHLVLGSHADNCADKIAKDRHAKGETQGSSKLTEADVKVIKSRRSESYKIICEDFGLVPSTVYRIWNNQSWKHSNAR